MSEENICHYCGERMDEYADCFESDSGKHVSIAEAKKHMELFRRPTPTEGKKK